MTLHLKILAEIILYGDDPHWTVRILSRHTRIPEQTVNTTLIELQIQGLLYRQRGKYNVTDAGNEYYDDAIRQPAVRASLQAWKNEVLSGMTAQGLQTRIERAALCKSYGDERIVDPDPERVLIQAQEAVMVKCAIARDLGIGMREYERRMKEGSIRACKGDEGDQHIGIFHRKHSSKKTGKVQWQDLCIQCRRKRRKKQ